MSGYSNFIFPGASYQPSSHDWQFPTSVKVLGIHIQNDLIWDTLVASMCTKTSRRLFTLRNLKKFGFNSAELLAVYTGYVHPLLEYSDVIWHSSITDKHSRMLEGIQRRAFRIILGFEYTSYENALHACKLETLSSRREEHCLKFACSLSKSARTCNLLPLEDLKFMEES